MELKKETINRCFFLIRKIFPDAMDRVPTLRELENARRETATKIASRQAEGNVLLAAGKLNMSGVDFSSMDDDEDRGMEVTCGR